MAVISVSTLHYLSFLGYPELWNGATADGTSSASAALQAAIDGCDGVLDLAPGATYLIDDAVTLKSGLHIRGNGATLLAAANCTSMLTYSSSGLEDLTVEGLRFDGTETYPEDETADKEEITPTYGIIISSAAAKRLSFRDLYFEKISGSSINITAAGGHDISIYRCSLLRGNYRSKGIVVYADDGSSEESRCTGIKIVNNHLEYGGPTAYVDAADEIYISSSDGIHIDGCGDFLIGGNTVKYAAAIGIRVEQSVRGEVSGNTVIESGLSGIEIYNINDSVAVIGNVVKSWGRIPYAGALYNYNEGTLVIPREFPHATLAPFPADPSASSWWEEWPYTTTGIDLETVRDYDDRSYYAGVSNGSLPFRGFCGIGIVQGSKNCTVVGNICIPDLTTDDGKYTHASDFGFSIVHVVNAPYDTSANLVGTLLGNIFAGRLASIHTPEYSDPINERGPLGSITASSNSEP